MVIREVKLLIYYTIDTTLEDDETPQTPQEAMRENESRAVTLIIGRVGIIIIATSLLILAIHKRNPGGIVLVDLDIPDLVMNPISRC